MHFFFLNSKLQNVLQQNELKAEKDVGSRNGIQDRRVGKEVPVELLHQA